MLYKWWEHYSTLGVDLCNSREENSKIRVMNQAYVFCGAGFFISFFLRWYFGLGLETMIAPAICSIFFALLPLFSYFKQPKLGWHTAAIFILVTITISSLVKPACYANYTLYGTIVFLVIFLHKNSKKIQSTYLAFTALNLVAFTYFSNLNPELNKGFPLAISIVIVFLALGANYIIIVLSLKNRIEREQELAYAISLKNAALNATKDAIFIVNLKLEITDYNQQYLEIWEFKEEELLRGNAALAFQKELSKINNREEVAKTINQIKTNPKTSTSTVRYLKNGRIVECHTQPQILENQVVGTVYSYREVTAQYEAAKKLAQSENRFRSFFEHSPIGIVILENKEQSLRSINKQFCEMVGYSAEELKTKTIKSITCPAYHNAHLAYQEDLENGLIDNFTIRKKYLRKSGDSFWGNLNISVTRDEQGAILSKVAMVSDINEEMEQEARIKDLIVELKLLNEELEQKVKVRTVDLALSNKELKRSNQDLEQFAYIASHDLQEPLRMVGNFVQLLERQYKDQIDKEGKEYIHYIVDGVNRMSKLIQNLLKYSRVGRKESELRKIDLGKIVEAKLFGLGRKIEETKAVIKINVAPPKIYCEPDQIGMVFFNLLTNALKFNTGNPIIAVNCEEKEAELLFSVKDNGIGIEQKYETKIFEIFKRLHRREDYEGTGIGLALCKKIIARHGGKIWFESEPNKGTTFYFTISKRLYHEQQIPVDSNLVS